MEIKSLFWMCEIPQTANKDSMASDWAELQWWVALQPNLDLFFFSQALIRPIKKTPSIVVMSIYFFYDAGTDKTCKQAAVCKKTSWLIQTEPSMCNATSNKSGKRSGSPSTPLRPPLPWPRSTRPLWQIPDSTPTPSFFFFSPPAAVVTMPPQAARYHKAGEETKMSSTQILLLLHTLSSCHLTFTSPILWQRGTFSPTEESNVAF